LPEFHLDLFYDYLTYRNYIDYIKGSVTASVTYMNYGQFVRTSPDSPDPIGTFSSYDFAATVGYATKLSDDWGLGFNFRVIHSSLSDQPTAEEEGSGVATSVSFDVGGMWRPTQLVLPWIDEDIGNKLSIGVNISNMGPKIFYIDRAQADPIPTNFRLGFAYRIFQDEFNSLTYVLDFSKLLVHTTPGDTATGVNPGAQEWYQAIFTSWGDKPLNQELQEVLTSMGMEYSYGQPGDFIFSVRAGYFYEDPSYGGRKFVTFGAGIRYDIYGFDFSYLTTSVFPGMEDDPLNNTLRFTLVVGWGSTPDKIQGLPRGI
jgi:hypothetical protein